MEEDFYDDVWASFEEERDDWQRPDFKGWSRDSDAEADELNNDKS